MTLLCSRRKSLLLKRESLVREQIHGGTYDALVDAMSRAIEKLIWVIACGIRFVAQKELREDSSQLLYNFTQ